MIADNRLTENSVWNDQLLAQQLRDLSLLSLDFSLEAIGFDMGEIDLRIESLNASSGDRDLADDLVGIPSGPSVTRLGDMWQLGENRVYCESALNATAYEALMKNEQAHAIVSDPPYNLRIGGNVSGLGKKRHREFAMASGEMSESEFVRFLVTILSYFTNYSAEGSLHYVFIDWRHIGQLLTAAREVYRNVVNICVWVKTNAGMGSFYRSQHEFVGVFRHGRGSHRNNVKLGRYGRNRSNVWHYAGANSFSRAGNEGNLLSVHPTPKSTELVGDVLMDFTARNDLVLDGFLGSGTTVIAAERTGRRCYGLEIDPLYVDATVRRWQAFTRADARHVSSGQTFNKIEAELGERDAGQKDRHLQRGLRQTAKKL
jgi:DNA modification methylase